MEKKWIAISPNAVAWHVAATIWVPHGLAASGKKLGQVNVYPSVAEWIAGPKSMWTDDFTIYVYSYLHVFVCSFLMKVLFVCFVLFVCLFVFAFILLFFVCLLTMIYQLIDL